MRTTKQQLANGCVDHACTKCSKEGYGLIHYSSGYSLTAHRLAWCKHHGIEYNAMPRGKLIHTCGNKRCINPLHMQFEQFKKDANNSTQD